MQKHKSFSFTSAYKRSYFLLFGKYKSMTAFFNGNWMDNFISLLSAYLIDMSVNYITFSLCQCVPQANLHRPLIVFFFQFHVFPIDKAFKFTTPKRLPEFSRPEIFSPNTSAEGIINDQFSSKTLQSRDVSSKKV